MNHKLRRFIYGLLFAVLVYGAFVLFSGYRELSVILSKFAWSSFAAALGLVFLNYVLRFAKWEYYLAQLEIRGVQKLDSFLIFLSGFVLTVTPGKVGEVFKSAVLAETHGVDPARSAPIVIAERLTDVIGVVGLILIGSTAFTGGLSWALAGLGCVVIGLLLILVKGPFEQLISFLGSRPGRLAQLAPKLETALVSLRRVAAPRVLVLPSLLSLVGWGLEGLALAQVLEGLGTPTPLPLCLFFHATATLAGALVPTPGGLGVAEALIQSQLVELGGASRGVATAAMLLIRFATLWFGVLVGFFALALLRLRHPQLLRGGPPKSD